MNKSILKIEFKSEIVLERSIIPTVESLGESECTMELFIHDKTYNLSWNKNIDSSGYVEWQTDYGEEFIGVWFDNNKRLIEYDGVFSLPKEAIKLLRKAGYKVPKDIK